MKNNTLFKLFSDFIHEVYPLIDPAIEKKWIKPKFEKYPVLKYNENGMPSLRNDSYSAPTKISDLFRAWNGKPDLEIKEFDSYKELLNYLLNHKEYISNIIPDNISSEKAEKWLFLAGYVIEEVLERYYLLNNQKSEDDALLLSIYEAVEKYIYSDVLHFDISIPILFLHFDIIEHPISDNILIRKIGDEYHKARFNIRSYSPPIADSVISSATHELVFRNYYIEKGNKYLDNNLGNENAYPLTKLELFFNALKIVTNNNSGFAQILVYPHDWADVFNMDLPVLKGVTVRKYPNYFDNFYWNEGTFPIIAFEQLKAVSSIYTKLLNDSNNKIIIANKRLRSSYLRDNEEDTILDIIIALESLLGDNEKGEITHKLALRISKLISLHNKNYNGVQVFNAVKKIYAFRSAVVHGSSKIDSKREIKLHEEAKPINTIALANDLLREVIRILLQQPQFLDPGEIDMALLKS